ncbi:outer envelope pore protein 21, chloroplastic-like [Aristolochia californica]|uniref:outer envelope pore protein 21, chloroplastic-like n=1 Tax=Aristolochia californica TaxID=171875 RepID=UPI0035DC0390
MQTSLRYDSDSKALLIHAKEKIPVDSKTLCQVHGELDTKIGAPSSLALIFRNFYPEFSASIGAGIRYDVDKKIKYSLLGKKAFPITSNGFVSFNLKGRYDVDDKLNEKKATGAAEFSWSILDFQRYQDVRLKVGYAVFEKVPYLQIRENNWTFNADMNGRWNVRFDL